MLFCHCFCLYDYTSVIFSYPHYHMFYVCDTCNARSVNTYLV